MLFLASEYSVWPVSSLNMTCLLKINGAFFFLHANVSPPDHTVFGWLSSFCSCSLVLCHRSWLWLSWSFAKLKMGQLPFLKWHKFVSLYLAHMSPAWEQREGVQLWWNDLVWIKAVSPTGSTGSDPVPCLSGGFSLPLSTSITLRQVFSPLVFLFLTVKCTEKQ